jgi:hypothetical protein
MRTAQESAYACDQLARAEGLDEIVVPADLETVDAFLLGALRGQHDDGDVGGVTDPPTDFFTGDLRQVQIENDQVEALARGSVEGGLPVSDRGHPVALALEVRGHGIADGALVLDEQDPG